MNDTFERIFIGVKICHGYHSRAIMSAIKNFTVIASFPDHRPPRCRQWAGMRLELRTYSTATSFPSLAEPDSPASRVKVWLRETTRSWAFPLLGFDPFQYPLTLTLLPSVFAYSVGDEVPRLVPRYCCSVHDVMHIATVATPPSW